jgi:hypothetical protein
MCHSDRLVCRTGRNFPTCILDGQTDTYQMLYWYNWFSWWWARGCSEDIENWNKHIEKKTLHQFGHLQVLYRDAVRSTEHKNNAFISVHIFESVLIPRMISLPKVSVVVPSHHRILRFHLVVSDYSKLKRTIVWWPPVASYKNFAKIGTLATEGRSKCLSPYLRSLRTAVCCRNLSLELLFCDETQLQVVFASKHFTGHDGTQTVFGTSTQSAALDVCTLKRT